MYGEDRLTRPLLRMRNGKFDKQGDFVPVTWEAGVRRDGAPVQAGARRIRTDRRRDHGLGAVHGAGGLRAVKLLKAGWRSNNIDPNARHCMASAVAAFMQVFGIDEPAGNYDDIELTDTVVTWGANMAEMHPMLWARVTDKAPGRSGLPGGQPEHVLQPHRRTSSPTPRSSSSPTRIWRSGTTSPARSCAATPWTSEFVREALRVRHRPLRHRLRHARDRRVRLRCGEGHAGAPARGGADPRRGDRPAQGPRSRPTASSRRNAGAAGKHWRISFEDFKKAWSRTAWTSSPSCPRAIPTNRWTTTRRS